jgi:hypothetical protein
MSITTQLRDNFDQKITAAIQVSEYLEQGQADMPLTELFQQLRQELNQQPFSISLLCLTDESRQAVLKWLYGHNFAVFSVQVSAQVGLLEVQLKDRGYSFEKSTGERQDFEQWEELVNALDDKTLQSFDANSELCIGTQTATDIKQLTVLVAESAHSIQQSPALMTRVLRESNVLMVAAPPSYALAEAEKKIINTLLDDMSCFIPLLPVDELSDEAALPEHGWWEQLQSLASLPVQLLTTHVNASLPGFLTEPSDKVRQTLQIQQLSKKYQSACDALADQFDDMSRQLNSRKKREARKQQASSTGGSENSQNSLRSRLNEGCSDLIKTVEEANRKSELITSERAVALKNYVEGLAADDLQKDDSYKAIKLSLSGEYQHQLMGFISQQNKAAFNDDLEQLQQALQQLVDDVCQTLNKQLGYRPTITTEKIDKSILWASLEQVLAMEVRYQGEMPKRGFFDRLGAGRQALMGLMMAGMVLGGLFEGIRNVLMIFGLPLFFIGVIYSYISYPKEEAARMDKELKRVRDEVLSNSRRLNSDVNRQKQSKLRDYIESLKKTWVEQVEKALSDAQQREQLEQQKQADTARKRVQGIEQKLAELQRQQLNMTQLKTGSQQLLNDSQQVLTRLAKQ